MKQKKICNKKGVGCLAEGHWRILEGYMLLCAIRGFVGSKSGSMVTSGVASGVAYVVADAKELEIVGDVITVFRVSVN